MADQAIGSLELAEVINGADLFVLEQNGEAKALSGAKLTEFIDRQVMDISVHDLSYTATPTAEYDRITGKLSLGIPRGNSIVSVSVNSEDKAVFTWADGTTVTVGTFRGPRGLSAYDYAVEKGYKGTETDFATLQLNLYNASLNEEERVKAEAKRQKDYEYMMDKVQKKMDEFDGMAAQTDMVIVDTTLVLYRESLLIADTTLLL